jgi:hypothetical protein
MSLINLNYQEDIQYYDIKSDVMICNQIRSNELNTRISNRNIPGNNLQPYFSPRPVDTKRVVFPILDQHKPSCVKLQQYDTYSTSTTFNPGSSAPWNGFSRNVNTESQLRNQFFALQNSDQSVYVPSSKSEIYIPYIPALQPKVEQPYDGLFKVDTFNKFNPNTLNVGKNVMYNSTRTQRLDT